MEERSEGWNCPVLKGLDESKEKDTRIFLGLIRVTLTLVSGPICRVSGCWLVAVQIRSGG